MGKAIIGNIVKSGISSLITGLQWFGAPVTAAATWNSGAEESGGIGLPFQHRLWIEKPSSLSIRIETILGYSDTIQSNEDAVFDANEYIFNLMNEQGYFEPVANQAALQSIGLNFNAGDLMTGTFENVVFRPNQELIEWFDTYSSEQEIPMGTGEQLQPLMTEETNVIVPDDPLFSGGIEGVSSASISMNIQFDVIETTAKRAGFIPNLPLGVDISANLYNDYFTSNQDKFFEGNSLSDIKVWKFRLVKPKIINVSQSNPSSGQRTWDVSLRAKKMTKEI